jgi:hypothetical protein
MYRGNQLPPFYIGSSSIDRLNEGYRGSVISNQYKATWNYEILNHPELFSTRIISQHSTREEAYDKELSLQKKLNVVKSPLYINLAFANGTGRFGQGRKGKRGKLWNNGKITKMFYEDPGPSWSKGRIWSKQHKTAIQEALPKRQWINNSGKPRGTHSIEFYKEISSRPRNLKMKICPHCGVEGSGGNMTRYHFNNCVTFRNGVA